ncbi:MAG: PolC-type DNA polymerase III, partial [Clostridiales bacterium]|nr:PolC-type DNA polymerase III [Clostridiales bacterium]
AVWIGENGALILEMPDEFAISFLKESTAQSVLKQAIYDVFRITPAIDFRVRSDYAARMERVRQMREQELEAISQEQEKQRAAQKPDPDQPKAIKGRKFTGDPVPIVGLTETSGTVIVAGRVVSVERKDLPAKEAVLMMFTMTDGTDSIRCKVFFGGRRRRGDETVAPSEADIAKMEASIAMIVPNEGLKVRGQCQHDRFENELVLRPDEIMQFHLPKREDNAPAKRVELHAHTQMSALDGIMSPTELINRAAAWGHQAVAITDHGVLQAFPEAFAAAAKRNIKLIPGVEVNLIDEADVVTNADDSPIDQTIVVLDFETTGLNPLNDRIIEIGAVKLVGGEVGDTFSSFVNPGMPLPPNIIELTGIQNADVENAPTAADVLPGFLAFLGEHPVAAHNADFDTAFLQQELARLGLARQSPQIDTLVFAQKMYPQLKRFRLSTLCKFLGITLRNAHRAVHDARATARCLAIMLSQVQARGAQTLEQVNELTRGFTKTRGKHAVLLARNRDGLVNLNRIVSLSHLKYFHDAPRVPRELITKHRDGLLVGSACAEGELFEAVIGGANGAELDRIAGFYDYLEIQPIDNHALLIKDGIAKSERDLTRANRRIVEIGQRTGRMVVATGDAHYLESEDSVYRSILHHSQHSRDYDDLPDLHLLTTQEMLDAMTPHLGEEDALRAVVTNPNAIADMVEDITLFPRHPEGKTTFSPLWPEAAEEIETVAHHTAHELYGDELPPVVAARLQKELSSIIGYGFATLYSSAAKLVSKSIADGYVVGSRGSVGSSLVARLCGITEVNPLAPHYRCEHCRHASFDVPAECRTGLDLPDKACPGCGQKMLKDGYDIPFEVFLGFEGDKVPDIDLNFSGDYQSTAHQYAEELFGQGYVFRAGTIGTLQEKTAFGLAMRYLEDHDRQASRAEVSRLAAGCVGVKRTTGQHPGGLVILPQGYEIASFTAVQYPADKAETETVTTHFDFASMHDILVKLDILGHDDPTMIHALEQITGIPYTDIPLDDPQVMSLFKSPEALGVTAKQLGCPTGTLGVPEFGTQFVRQMLVDTQPTTMEELIRISGLSHGTGVWLGNARDIIAKQIATLSQCICTRDDIMNYLIGLGMPAKVSFDIMEHVRKGRRLTQGMQQAMHEASVPQWFIDSCLKIGYMFPKGHAVAYVIMALRVAWFKLYHPLAYYAAYFSIRAKGFDALDMARPVEQIQRMVDDLANSEERNLTDKDKESLVSLEVLLEMGLRGFAMLPPDLYKSDATRFMIEGNALRAPFTSLKGFGEQAAQSVVEQRKEPFVSIEDLSQRTKVSSAGIDLLTRAGALRELSDTNQLDFMQMLNLQEVDDSGLPF